MAEAFCYLHKFDVLYQVRALAGISAVLLRYSRACPTQASNVLALFVVIQTSHSPNLFSQFIPCRTHGNQGFNGMEVGPTIWVAEDRPAEDIKS